MSGIVRVRNNVNLLKKVLLLLVGTGFLVAYVPHILPPFGLDSVEAIGPYLNNNFPPNRPSGNANFATEIAYPDLSFNSPVNLRKDTINNRIYIAEKRGKVVSFEDVPGVNSTTTVLDIEVNTTQGTGTNGLTGFILHPEFGKPGSPNRGYFYVYYRHTPDTALRHIDTIAYRRLVRYNIPDGSNVADPNSETVLINQFARSHIHGGGGMFFGPDGFLYLGLGDEGLCCEQNSTQRYDQWLFGGVLRIDVDQDPSRSHPIRRQPISNGVIPAGWPNSFTANYYIPNDNPWIDENGAYLEEFFAIGIRHAYSIKYDPDRGEIWEGDIGELTFEEINKIEKGANYEWPFLEAGKVHLTTLSYEPNNLEDVFGTRKGPIVSLDRNTSNGVIAGGVYRGNLFPSLVGKFLFADHAQGTIYIIDAEEQGPITQEDITLIASIPGSYGNAGISNFTFMPDGEIYITKMNGNGADGGRIYKLITQGTPNPEPPALLSQTGAFANLATLTPSAGLIPYETQAQLYSDDALKKRWIAIPHDGTPDSPDEQIVFSADSVWSFPEGTVFIKHFELPLDANNPSLTTRLETRFTVLGPNKEYYSVTYRWNEAQTDANLLATSETRDISVLDEEGKSFVQTWTFPSRINCFSCHTSNTGGVLGFNPQQLNGEMLYPSTNIVANQLETLNHLNLFDQDIGDHEQYFKSNALSDPNATLEKKIRSYLDGNCSSCHQPNGVEGAFDARIATPLSEQKIIGAVSEGPNSTHPFVVSPGNTQESGMWVRDQSLTNNLMPPIGRSRVDEPYITALTEWVNGLAPTQATHFEVGEVGQASIGNDWETINLQRVYTDPVLIAGAVSNGEMDPLVVRIQNLNSTSFQIRLQEWDCEDGTHMEEHVAYWVMEAGVHELPNGNKLIAGNQSGVGSTLSAVSFSEAFAAPPLLFTQLSGYAESDAAMSQFDPSSLTNEGFSVRIVEKEGGGTHAAEQVSWIALEEGRNNRTFGFEASTLSGVSSANFILTHQQSYSGNPLIFASQASTNEADPASFRYMGANQTDRRSTIFLQEEVCGDGENTHTGESVHYFLFERPAKFYSLRDPATNQAPVAAIASSAQGGMEPISIDFDGSASIDPDNDPITYLWNFGDGTSSTELLYTHLYDEPGEFTVTLTVTDILGLADTDTLIVSITPNTDFTPPTVPGNLAAGEITQSSINLLWDPSTDSESGVAGYYVYQNTLNNQVGNVVTPGILIEDLASSTEYLYWVVAYDVAGNLSDPAGPLSVVTEDGAPEACSDVINLALGKSASQSTVYGLGIASVAVDGDKDGTRGPWENASIAHTTQENRPWWQVDLDTLARITQIRLYNRTDCCKNRLRDFYLLFSDQPFAPEATLDELLVDPNVSVVPQVAAVGDSLYLDVDEAARYVRLQVSFTTLLHFAEIEIYGCNSGTCLNPPSVTVTPSDAQSCGGTGSVDLIANPSGGTWTVRDALGNKVPDVSELEPGFYSWQYAFFACTEQGSFTIEGPEEPVVTIDPAGPFTNDQPVQTLSASPEGGTWGGAANSQGQFDPGMGEGNYEVYYTFTNTNSCSVTDTLTILVTLFEDEEAPTTPTNFTVIDSGFNYITLSWDPSTDNVGVAGYYIYLDGNNSPHDTITVGTTATLNDLNSGTLYQVAISAFDQSGNVSLQSQGINVRTLSCNVQITETTSEMESGCETGDASITIKANGDSLEYSINGGLSYQQLNVFEGLGAGTYQIFVREANQTDCLDSTQVTIDESAKPQIISTNNSTDPTACGADDGSIVIFADGNNLEYSIDGGESYQISNIFSGLGGGLYPLAVRDTANPSCIARDTVTFLVPSLPEIVMVNSLNPSACDPFSGSISLEMLGINLEYSFDDGLSYQTASVMEDLGAGTYMIRVREIGYTDCFVDTTISLEEGPGPSISSIEIMGSSGCTEGDGSLSIQAAGENLAYSVDGGASFQDSATFMGLSQGTYFIVVQDQDNSSCSSSDTVVVTGVGAPIIDSLDVVEPMDCGEVRGSITVFASGESLEYSIDEGQSYQAAPVFSGLLGESFTIFVREVANPTCVSSTTVNFSALLAPQISSINTEDPSDCGLVDGSITVFAEGENLRYSIDGGTTFQNSNRFGDLAGGAYELVITSADNPTCSTSDRVTLSAPFAPEITGIKIINPSGCGLTDGSISIEAGGEGLEYSIDGGETFQSSSSYAELAEGTYQIVVKDSKDQPCITTEVAILQSPVVPVINEVLTQDPDCEDSNGSIQVTATGKALEYSIDGGATYQITSLFENLARGTYEVTIREVNTQNCEVSESVDLVSPDVPVINGITSSDVTNCTGANGVIEINATGENLQYSIDGGTFYHDTNRFENLGTGTYFVFIREGENSNCIASQTVEISKPGDCSDIGEGQVSLAVQPNPFNGAFKMTVLGEISEDAWIQISNPLGQVLYVKSLNGSNTLDLGEELTEGVYWLTLRSGLHIEIVKILKTDE